MRNTFHKEILISGLLLLSLSHTETISKKTRIKSITSMSSDVCFQMGALEIRLLT